MLEITETTLIENVGSATSILMELRKLGIRIALDDFGEGYSSLAYLANLPVDILKISGQFAMVFPSARDVAVIDTVIGMAKRLDIVVVVEGIELANQMEFLPNGVRPSPGFLSRRASSHIRAHRHEKYSLAWL